MRVVLALSWRLLRSGDGRARIGAVLVLAAVTASTALMMFAVAANHAFEARAEREARAKERRTEAEGLNSGGRSLLSSPD